MSTYTLSGWKNTAAGYLVTQLPLQTVETAYPLVEVYLASVGGWIPDDIADPTGLGVAANGQTPAEAVTDIVADAMDRVYHCSLTVSVDVNVDFHSNLVAGQNTASALAAIEAKLRDFIAAQLDMTNLQLVDVTAYDGTVNTDGFTNQADRLSIQSDISQNINTDARSVGLVLARSIFGLPTTWNVYSLYLEDGSPIVVRVRKYQSTQYQTLDGTATQEYVLTLDPETFSLVSGIRLNL